MESYWDPAGQTVWTVHNAEDCRGEHCPFHRPSDHPLIRMAIDMLHVDDARPGQIRTQSLILRKCAHLEHHPDPDSMAYMLTEGILRPLDLTHTCSCFCCRRTPTPEEWAAAQAGIAAMFRETHGTDESYATVTGL